MHGSMRRREATPASRPARAAPEASRRPYKRRSGRGAAGLSLRLQTARIVLVAAGGGSRS